MVRLICVERFSPYFYGDSRRVHNMHAQKAKLRDIFHIYGGVKTQAGTRAFSVAVPTLWNSIPGHVKSSNGIVSFGHHLKTRALFQTRLSFL